MIHSLPSIVRKSQRELVFINNKQTKQAIEIVINRHTFYEAHMQIC